MYVCLPVIYMSLVQHTMTITDDRVENLLPNKHLGLEQLQVHTHLSKTQHLLAQQLGHVLVGHVSLTSWSLCCSSRLW